MTRNGDAAIVRQFALIGATVVFYSSQQRFSTDATFAWVIAVSCALNVGLVALGAFGAFARRSFVRMGSSLLGLGTWAGLIRLTDGIESSPFLPSLWLEVLLGALTFSSTGIALTTVGAVGALWLAEPSPGAVLTMLALHSVFLIAMGTGVLLTHRRWRQAQARLSHEVASQAHNLHELQTALEDLRAVSVTGESTARLAHRLKNAVHGLRGFARLVESEFQVTGATRSLEGLHVAIDQIGDLASETLKPIPNPEPAEHLEASRLRAIIEGVVAEVFASYPALRIEKQFWHDPHVVRFSSGPLRDIVNNLLLNSAEATHGHGLVRVETRVTPEGWLLCVTDDGPGIAPQVAARLFRPGVTSKPDGHGVGLFVSQRHAAAGGGRLWADRLQPRGTCFHVLLPTAETPC